MMRTGLAASFFFGDFLADLFAGRARDFAGRDGFFGRFDFAMASFDQRLDEGRNAKESRDDRQARSVDAWRRRC